MDIFEDSCDHDSIETLELDRFKSKVREIWQRMLQEAYANNPPEDMDEAHYMEHNALKFADEPQEANEADNLMEMLEELLDSKEELEDVSSEGKAPSYGSSSLKSNNEQGSKEATNYEYNHTSSKTPSDSRSGGKGGSYEGTPSGNISKKKDDRVIRSFAPMAESLKDELKALIERQSIGKRRQLFR
mgnify:FL=1|tara:strand:- start:422 stop:982 length:561 start_codon:yes stop_codon:yes gene_type:complete